MNFCTWANILTFVSKAKDMSPYNKTFGEGVWYHRLQSEVWFVAFDNDYSGNNDYSGKRSAEHFQDYHICIRVNI